MTTSDQTTSCPTGTDRSGRRPIPVRVLERPDPSQWGEHELMNFKEAVALFWRQGPLTEHSLRTVHRNGILGVAVIAGKFLTTKAAIAEMGVCVRKTIASVPEKPLPNRDAAKAKAAAMVDNFRIRLQDELANQKAPVRKSTRSQS